MPDKDVIGAPFSVRMFGPMEVLIHGNPLPKLRSRKGLWIVALLALANGKELDRSWIAYTLWPDSDEDKALGNLRQSIYDMRIAMGSESERLISSATKLRLNTVDADIDIITFDECVTQADPFSLETAISLYNGPLLTGCSEEWIFADRTSREERYLFAIQTLANIQISEGDLNLAIHNLRLATAVDPLRESVQRSLMTVLFDAGDVAAACLTYRELRSKLRAEGYGEPSPEITALYERIRAFSRERAEKMSNVSVGEAAPKSYPIRDKKAVRIPRTMTTIVDRSSEISTGCSLIRQNKLTTLTGAGGVGKTRLSLAIAEQISSDFLDGVDFMDLSHIFDQSKLEIELANKFEIAESSTMPMIDSLIAQVDSKSILLILDNCEQVILPVTKLCLSILAECPAVHILVTSRQPLNIPGEVILSVPPLGIPPIFQQITSVRQKIDVKSAGKYGAVKLFIDRSRALIPNFELTSVNCAEVVEICRQLDGLPLGIEIAASKTRVLSTQQILARLKSVFTLLTNTARDIPDRQSNLRALIEWSFSLLSLEEKEVLYRLSVFSSGWSLEAAEYVCLSHDSTQSEGEALIHQDDFLPLLSQLVEKSLVEVVEEPTGRRFRFLNIILAFLRESCPERVLIQTCKKRHLEYFTTVAVACGNGMRGERQSNCIWTFVREQLEFESALDFAEANSGYLEYQLKLTSSLWRLWMMRGYLSSGLSRIKNTLSHSIPDELLNLKASVLNGAAGLAWNLGDFPSATIYLKECLCISRELGEPLGIALALNSLGNIALTEGRYMQARDLYDESLGIRRQHGAQYSVGASLNNLGVTHLNLRDLNAARHYHEEALQISKSIGDIQGELSNLTGLSNVSKVGDDFRGAERIAEQALHIADEIGDREAMSGMLVNLAHLSMRLKEVDHAKDKIGDALQISLEINDPRGLADALETACDYFHRMGNKEVAIRLFSAVDTLRKRDSIARSVYDEEYLRQKLTTLRRDYPGVEFDYVWNAGASMTLMNAAEYALNELAAGQKRPADSRPLSK